MFEQAVLTVQNEQVFKEVNSALERAFASATVVNFLRKVAGAGLRIREFESVLTRGLLGSSTPAQYGALGDSDRGQVRERYLQLVEQVPVALRGKFLKIYAYY
jgi:hypothetical protein